MQASNSSEGKTLCIKTSPEQEVPKSQEMFAPTKRFLQTCLLEPVSVLPMFLRAQYILAFVCRADFSGNVRFYFVFSVRRYFVCGVQNFFFVCSAGGFFFGVR